VAAKIIAVETAVFIDALPDGRASDTTVACLNRCRVRNVTLFPFPHLNRDVRHGVPGVMNPDE
jgi:hypothetical protein